MTQLELTPKQTDILYDLILHAVTVRAGKIVKLIAEAEEMTPSDVRSMLAAIGVQLKERPGEARLVRFNEEVKS